MYLDPYKSQLPVVEKLAEALLCVGGGGLGFWFIGWALSTQGIALPDDFDLASCLALAAVLYAMSYLLSRVLRTRR